MKAPLIRNERFVQIGAPLLVGVLVLLVWQLTVMAFEVPKYLVPSPVDIGQSLVSDFPSLFNALLMTLKVTFLAFAIAVMVGPGGAGSEQDAGANTNPQLGTGLLRHGVLLPSTSTWGQFLVQGLRSMEPGSTCRKPMSDLAMSAPVKPSGACPLDWRVTKCNAND